MDAAQQHAARAELRRLVAVAGASRGRTNDQRRRGMGALPAALSAEPAERCRSCRWPMWPRDGEAAPLFCAAPTKGGRSYCGDHLDIALIREDGTPAYREAQSARRRFLDAWGAFIAQDRVPAETAEAIVAAVAEGMQRIAAAARAAQPQVAR